CRAEPGQPRGRDKKEGEERPSHVAAPSLGPPRSCDLIIQGVAIAPKREAAAPRWAAATSRSSDPFAGRKPAGARGAELGLGALLVFCGLHGGQRVAPAPVQALVDEYLCSRVPEGSAERNGPGRVRLHPRERAVLQDGSPTLFVDRDLQKRRN